MLNVKGIKKTEKALVSLLERDSTPIEDCMKYAIEDNVDIYDFKRGFYDGLNYLSPSVSFNNFEDMEP